MAIVKAQWSIELHCRCPECSWDFDLTDQDEFFENVSPAEHETKNSTDIEVECPDCQHKFTVDYEY